MTNSSGRWYGPSIGSCKCDACEGVCQCDIYPDNINLHYLTGSTETYPALAGFAGQWENIFSPGSGSVLRYYGPEALTKSMNYQWDHTQSNSGTTAFQRQLNCGSNNIDERVLTLTDNWGVVNPTVFDSGLAGAYENDPAELWWLLTNRLTSIGVGSVTARATTLITTRANTNYVATAGTDIECSDTDSFNGACCPPIIRLTLTIDAQVYTFYTMIRNFSGSGFTDVSGYYIHPVGLNTVGNTFSPVWNAVQDADTAVFTSQMNLRFLVTCDGNLLVSVFQRQSISGAPTGGQQGYTGTLSINLGQAPCAAGVVPNHNFNVLRINPGGADDGNVVSTANFQYQFI